MDLETFEEIVVNTFENTAFWEAEFDEDFNDISELPENPFICSIDITSPYKAKLTFIASHDVVEILSNDINQNLFDDEEESIEDCVKEIMNIIGGDFGVHIFPEDDFELSIPEIEPVLNLEKSSQTLKFECDEGNFYMNYFSEKILLL
jgi:hypothetical protein